MAHWLFLAGFLTACGVAQAVETEVRFPKKHFNFFDAYCLDCHDTDSQKGKVDLEALSFNITSIEQAELWQKVLDAMNAGEMPPEKKTQPKSVEKADFLEDLAKTMVLARKKLSDSGGQITMRRLNRREYQNTMKSLTGVSLNVESLPPDAGGGALMKAGYSSAPQCVPSRAGLMVGRVQNEFAFPHNQSDAGDGMGRLPRTYPKGSDLAGKPVLTIADRMKKLGYLTGFSGKWHLGPWDLLFLGELVPNLELELSQSGDSETWWRWREWNP